MLKVGITGGIGSGKSVVCEVFTHLGIPVYSADDHAKMLMHKDRELKNAIKSVFGEVYLPEGGLDRARLAEKVFNNPEALKQLNNLVHPAVQKDYHAWLERHKDAPYTVKEAAIIFEIGSADQYDHVVLVTAPDELRIERVMHRDGVERTKVLERMKNQWPESRKIELADEVIHNDGKQMILPQILAIDKKLRDLA